MELTLRDTRLRSVDPALLRINLTYALRHGRMAELVRPTRFTELVQLRKLFDRDRRMVHLSDKVAVKQVVAERLGREWCIPTSWWGAELPAEIPVTIPAIIKSSHGCNQFRILRQPPTARQWQSLRANARRWVQRPYGVWLDEWLYRDIPRAMLAEPLIGGDTLPVDYKIYVFGGRATHVQVHLGREGRHRWVLHDRSYTPLVRSADHPPRPGTLDAMFDAAETLAAGFSFARVDFYEDDGRPLFGEFSFYPGSGLDRFAADWIDEELGQLWLAEL